MSTPWRLSLGTRYTRKTAKLVSEGLKEKPKPEERLVHTKRFSYQNNSCNIYGVEIRGRLYEGRIALYSTPDSEFFNDCKNA